MLSKRWLINIALILLIAGLALVGVQLEDQSAGASHPSITQLTPADIHSIDIQYGDIRLELSRSAHGWNLASPIDWPAYDDNVERLLSIVKSESKAIAAASEVDLDALGLLQPTAILSFNDTQLRFGSTNNIGGRRYLMIDSKLYLLPDVHLAFIGQGVAGLVDRRLLPPGLQIVSLELPEFKIHLDESKTWRTDHNVELAQSRLIHLIGNWQGLQATRITRFNPDAIPRNLIVANLHDGQIVDFLLMSVAPEIVIAHPKIGLQYHFRAEFHDQLISIREDEDDESS